jgi:hypothetical protein
VRRLGLEPREGKVHRDGLAAAHLSADVGVEVEQPRNERVPQLEYTPDGSDLAGLAKCHGVVQERRTASRTTAWVLRPSGGLHDGHMLMCMQSTSVRIDVTTHDELKRLAADLNTTVGHTVSLAVRALRQDRIGGELITPLREDETAWLDADLG